MNAFILKDENDINFNRLLVSLNTAAKKVGLIITAPRLNYNSNKEISYCTLNIGEEQNDSNGFRDYLVYLETKSDNDEINKWEWLPKKNLCRPITFECFVGCEDILLKFMKAYLEDNPDDYLYFEGYDFYFDINSIIEISKHEYDDEWCYKKPHRTK